MTREEHAALCLARYRAGQETWLDVPTASAITGTPEVTLYRWARAGVVKSGRQYKGKLELEMGTVLERKAKALK
jgi:hypothetical protein